jgi:hypothetical protein
MIKNIYAMYDVKANFFTPPVAMRTDEEAKRMFLNSALGVDTLKNNPLDFTMYKLATFDDVTGVIESDTPSVLMEGRELQRALVEYDNQSNEE